MQKTTDYQLNKRLRPLAHMPEDGLLIHEIFASVQGESSHAGLPCTFVRTTACHLRCSYCDTRHAFAKGGPMSLGAIEAEVERLGLPLVELTGGEPLLQPRAPELLRRLCDAGYTVMLETSGALPVGGIDPRVIKIIDLKTPSSGEVAANDYTNLGVLQAHDEIKFVLGSRADYEWARDLVRTQSLDKRCTVLMGPVFDALQPKNLVAWILEDRLPVRMQLQLHKFIWDPAMTGV